MLTFFQYFGIGAFGVGALGLLLITDPLPISKEEELEFRAKKDGKVIPQTDSDLKERLNESKSKEPELLWDNDTLRDSGKLESSLDQSKISEKPVEVFKSARTEIRPVRLRDISIIKDPFFLHAFFVSLIGYFFPHFGLFTFKSLGLNQMSD